MIYCKIRMQVVFGGLLLEMNDVLCVDVYVWFIVKLERKSCLEVYY